MKYALRRLLRDQAGISLFEAVVAITIAALIIVPVAGIMNQFVFLPGQWQATIATLNNARTAAKSIAEDARQANTFTTSTAPDYGTFAWTDRIGYPTSSISIRYFHESTTQSLFREETRNGDPTTNLVAVGISAYADVSIQASSTLIIASVTTTEDSIVADIQRNDKIRAYLRPLQPTAQPTPVPFRTAWDDFGSVSIVSTEPFEGTYHMRMTGASDFVERTIDLTDITNVRLQFQAQPEGFAASDAVELQVSDDGAAYTTVFTWNASSTQDVYAALDVDLSVYTSTSEFYIAFSGSLAGGGDGFLVDDIEVVRTWEE